MEQANNNTLVNLAYEKNFDFFYKLHAVHDTIIKTNVQSNNNNTMPVEFEFTLSKDFSFVQVFAEHFNLAVVNNQVALPNTLGKGYIKEISLNNGVSLSMHQYYLKENLILKRRESEPGDMLTIKFTHSGFFSSEKQFDYSHFYKASHSTEITTNNLFTQAIFPKNAHTNLVVMTLSRKTLVSLLQLNNTSASLKNIILNDDSFVFYESMNVEMERAMVQIQSIDGAAHLSNLHYETKVYELLYQLFNKLLTRNIIAPISIHQDDAEKIYALKNTILANLSLAPQLPELARNIGMSETKMKRLFHHVFGQSVYNCFQSARMNEAARMLTNLSVSETGYKLGFTNLSHFTRLFEKHHQVKPKRYKDSLGLSVNNSLHL